MDGGVLWRLEAAAGVWDGIENIALMLSDTAKPYVLVIIIRTNGHGSMSCGPLSDKHQRKLRWASCEATS